MPLAQCPLLVSQVRPPAAMTCSGSATAVAWGSACLSMAATRLPLTQ